MRTKITGPHWIQHTHYMDPDEYECSSCGKRFRKITTVCPNCKTHLQGKSKTDEWFEEALDWDLILEDD